MICHPTGGHPKGETRDLFRDRDPRTPGSSTPACIKLIIFSKTFPVAEGRIGLPSRSYENLVLPLNYTAITTNPTTNDLYLHYIAGFGNVTLLRRPELHGGPQLMRLLRYYSSTALYFKSSNGLIHTLIQKNNKIKPR